MNRSKCTMKQMLRRAQARCKDKRVVCVIRQGYIEVIGIPNSKPVYKKSGEKELYR